MAELGNHDLNAVSYDDVHANFTWEEWTLLNPSQKNLHKDVMLETYRNLTTIGYNWEDYDTEEHCQSSRRHERVYHVSLWIQDISASGYGHISHTPVSEQLEDT
nr:zinc finger protein 431-like [Peromyscus maniculatus bairdii]